MSTLEHYIDEMTGVETFRISGKYGVYYVTTYGERHALRRQGDTEVSATYADRTEALMAAGERAGIEL